MCDRHEYHGFTLAPLPPPPQPRALPLYKAERFFTGTVLFLVAMDFGMAFVIGGLIRRSIA